MGQYGNQPDFATRANNIVPTGDTNPANGKPSDNLNSAALYIGTGGTLICEVVGGNGSTGYTVFEKIPNGTFFPVIVNKVYELQDGDPTTTCSGIIALY